MLDLNEIINPDSVILVESPDVHILIDENSADEEDVDLNLNTLATSSELRRLLKFQVRLHQLLKILRLSQMKLNQNEKEQGRKIIDGRIRQKMHLLTPFPESKYNRYNNISNV